ncbi:MAG: hypothetical protein DRR08_11220 [Candidatus Parabeggiatoa sp. nov. 2]|nr:MAG: hypothetical protein B6247_27950 [Beggiatoa sp. 4572_84]RKZ60461.1 MAG: hypothetical protein DRR08_11220 [Gammaproteobacteria bacterium]
MEGFKLKSGLTNDKDWKSAALFNPCCYWRWFEGHKTVWKRWKFSNFVPEKLFNSLIVENYVLYSGKRHKKSPLA